MKREYKREINSLIGQILMLFILIVGTYFIFTGSRLASFASTAGAYSKANLDLQVLYGKDTDAVLLNKNILDKGVLSVRNPNKQVVRANINLKISQNVDLNTIGIIINDSKLDTTNYTISDGFYVLEVEQYEMGSFEEKYYDTKITGDPFFTSAFEYNYDITESFYV